MNKELSEIITGIKRAVGLMSPKEKRNLIIAVCIMLLTGILTNLPALILGSLVDGLPVNRNIPFGYIIPFVVLIIIIILVREALTIIRKYIVENVATHSEKEQTVRVIERLLKTDIGEYLYKQQIGSLHGRIFRSIQGLVRVIKLTFLDFAPIFFSALAAIAIAFLARPFIASLMILVIPAGLYLIAKQISSQKGIRVALLRGKEEVDGKVVEMLGGIETIRVSNTTAYEVGKIEGILERLRFIEMRHHIAMALFDAAKYLNEAFFYILVITISVLFASQGVITKGDILVYSILFLSIMGPLREIHRILDQEHEGALQVNDLYKILNQSLDLSFNDEKEARVQDIHGGFDIQAKNVSFFYGEKSENGVLEGVSLQIKKGEWVGIVGASGCGKTTFIRILLKLTHGYSGDIYLFGKKLLHVTREEISRKVSYVPQKPFIFSGTIKENILYGIKRSVSEKELVHAAKEAQIFDEIKNKLGGFAGKVGETGNNLSGGQRQRLALARVMLQSPELIILDEATSALDNTNETKIQKNLEKKFKGKTVISIAHRLTTLKNCDKILVFERGRIVQEGTYEYLSKTNGLFQDFLKQKQTR